MDLMEDGVADLNQVPAVLVDGQDVSAKEKTDLVSEKTQIDVAGILKRTLSRTMQATKINEAALTFLREMTQMYLNLGYDSWRKMMNKDSSQ